LSSAFIILYIALQLVDSRVLFYVHYLSSVPVICQLYITIVICMLMQVNFEPDTRQQYLKLLGYTQSAVQDQVKESLQKHQDLQSGRGDNLAAEDQTEHVS